MKTSSEILITRYGGIIPIIQEMMKRGIPELIDSSLDSEFKRKHNSKYKFSDVFISWIAASLCGATRIDNVTGLRKDLEVIPGLTIPSHDTIGRMMKILSSEIKTQDRKMNNQINKNYYDDNITLNRLLIQATKHMGMLQEDNEYILDVDCTFIDTRCAGAISMKDKDAPGFYPMICLIGNLPVFVEMRNGNSVADFRIKECIEQCLDLLEEANIKVKIVRTDGAGYRRDLLTMLENRNVKFLTASPVNAYFKSMLNAFEKTQWTDIKIETANAIKDCQIGEIKYLMTDLDTPFRVIALKIPTENKILELYDKDELERRCLVKEKMETLKKRGVLKSSNKRYSDSDWNIIKDFHYKMMTTNDFDTPAEDFIYLYNKRGDAERKFSFMKNDFGWNLPPFMYMNENTVFFIISALANNIFRAIAEILNEHVDELELNARVRRFQKAFIDTIAICTNGQWAYYNTKIDFGKIA